MNNTYEPEKKEIFKEIFNDHKDKFNNYKDKWRQNNSKVKKFINSYAEICAFGISIPYVLPAVIIKNEKDEETTSVNISNAEAFGGVLGIFSAAAAHIISIKTLYIDNPEYLAIPAATNIASGIYEFYKGPYKNAKNKLIEKHIKDISDTI